jgi:hypothetical protein
VGSNPACPTKGVASLAIHLVSGRTMLKPAAFAATLLLAGCGDYAPYVKADRDSPKFAADVAACQDQGAAEADRRAKARGPLFMTYPVSYPILERQQIAACMHARGYEDAD